MIKVQLVRPPPQPAVEPLRLPQPQAHSAPRALHQHFPSLSAQPPTEVSPEWQVKPEGPTAADLAAAPFANGRRRASGPAPRPPCRTQSWDRPIDCPPDDAELAAAKADPAQDAATAAFEATGRYKRAMKTYQELPGGKGVPGIKCAIFHKC